MKIPRRPQLALPDARPPIDTVALAEIADAEKYLIHSYRKILTALIEKAKSGSVGAIDIARKVVADYKSEQVEQVQRIPTPTPLSIKIGMYQMGQTLLGDKGAVLEVTASEVEQLPEATRAELGDKLKVLAALPAPVEAVVIAEPEPNRRCQNPECKSSFFSRALNVKWCPHCAASRKLAKLVTHKEHKRAVRAAKAESRRLRNEVHANQIT